MGQGARPPATVPTDSPADSPADSPVDVLVNGHVDVDVDRAAALLAGVARTTRLAAAPALSATVGTPVLLKCEHEQHTGSFKLRGAYARVAGAEPARRARGVVAASAGNHAQGVAYAAAAFGVPATIFVPEGANPLKVERTRRWGAEVVAVAGGVDAALGAARDTAAATGGLLVHPFDDAEVVAGQATVGAELGEQLAAERVAVSTVLVGVGGGGLLAGVALALKRRLPGVRVVGVQASGACAFATSWRAGRRLSGPARTIADGMAVQLPGALPLALAARYVDDVVTVPDPALWAAMALLLREEGHVVEPAGAAGVAALLADPALAQGPAAVVLSGGNVDPDVARRVAALARRRPPAPVLTATQSSW